MRYLLSLVFVALSMLAIFDAEATAQRRRSRPDPNRRIPREGVAVPPAVRAELESGLDRLATQLAEIKEHEEEWVRELSPDVEIFHRAVAQALAHREFLSERDLAAGPRLLEIGLKRAAALLSGDAPWTRQTGSVVLGFTSKLDGTAQPYGLLVPVSYPVAAERRNRLDVWLHGRNESICEVGFINQQLAGRAKITPTDAFVLSPFGRYSNAFRFAGEVDVWESLEDAQRRYRIDEDRISVRGFSMGGAGCWHLALHNADRFFAATPGAGFSETAEFLGIYRARNGQTPEPPPWHEIKLWNLYDGPGYALNLFHCPTIAYSGEIDRQKQAADVMEKALADLGIEMVHIIGPDTGHAIHDDSLRDIETRLASLAKRGREIVPSTVHLTAYTLKYNKSHWVQIDSLEEHWEQAQVDASLDGESGVRVVTKNVAGLTLSMDSGWCRFPMDRDVALSIDGDSLAAPRPASDRSWHCQVHRTADGWQLGTADETKLRKRHNLQGPVDDAFMDSFVFVRPTGQSAHAQFESWSTKELEHAIAHWRQHFRGDAQVVDDQAVTDDDIASRNLVLFGDPSSNSILRRIADDLPVLWRKDTITVGDQEFTAADHAPILVYPNPLNPQRYVVLNSGFTFREYDYYNNARQTPKIPDWAIVDIRQPVNNRYPGKIVAADFFDESWQLKKGDRR